MDTMVLKMEELEQLGTNAVRELRINKFKSGNPFLINSKDLPSNQCYLEYANGKIILSSFSSGSHDFVTIRELTDRESATLRSKLELDYIPT
jgi:hypothetical protein